MVCMFGSTSDEYGIQHGVTSEAYNTCAKWLFNLGFQLWIFLWDWIIKAIRSKQNLFLMIMFQGQLVIKP